MYLVIRHLKITVTKLLLDFSNGDFKASNYMAHTDKLQISIQSLLQTCNSLKEGQLNH